MNEKESAKQFDDDPLLPRDEWLPGFRERFSLLVEAAPANSYARYSRRCRRINNNKSYSVKFQRADETNMKPMEEPVINRPLIKFDRFTNSQSGPVACSASGVY
jgi:hypothetical protein